MMEHIVKLLLILSLSSGVFGEDNYGYLFLNNSRWWPICEQPFNDICGIQNRTVDIGNLKMRNNWKTIANSVNNSLGLFTQLGLTANATCRSAIVDYSCADIQTCDDANTTFGMDIARKTRACFNRQACSEKVKRNFGLNYWKCENITTFWPPPRTLRHCIHLPDTKNICPNRNYKVYKTVQHYYSKQIEMFGAWLDQLKRNVSSSCAQTCTRLYCYIAGGPVCYQEGRLFVHAINREECREAIKKVCPPSLTVLFVMCETLPQSNTTRAPLPQGINASSILESDRDGKNTEPPTANGGNERGDGNKTDSGERKGKNNGKREGNPAGLLFIIHTILFMFK